MRVTLQREPLVDGQLRAEVVEVEGSREENHTECGDDRGVAEIAMPDEEVPARGGDTGVD